MSGYSDIEQFWLERVRAISGYDESNTSRGKWHILNSGRAERYVILKPGTHSREMNSIGGGRLETYTTILEVWQKYRDDGDTLTTLETAVNALLNSIDQYPRLGQSSGGGVRKGEIVEVREVIQSPADAPSWLMCALVGQTNEEKTISIQD